MSDETVEKVGFRDIYNAVGDSEKRIKEHVSLALLPLTLAMADHEARIRSIEEKGSDEARAALAAAEVLGTRVTVIEKSMSDVVSAGVERRRLASLTNKFLAATVLISNFVLGLIVMFANLLSAHKA